MSATSSSAGNGASGATGASDTTGTSSSNGSSSASGSCCDCDDDKFSAEGTCGGNDCDDHDALVYPGEPVYYATAAGNPAIGFDYDCSGTPDPNPELNHTVSCMAIGLPCTTTEGYLATVPPSCGASGAWGTCKQQGVGCVDDVIDSARVMTCK